MSNIVRFQNHKHKGQTSLLVSDTKEKRPKFTIPFIVHQSLSHSSNDIDVTDQQQSAYPPEMTVTVERGAQDGSNIHLLKIASNDAIMPLESFPLLGRNIISGSVKWGTYTLRLPGEFNYITKYWEWTEDILSHFSTSLKECSLYEAVYASLYSYDRDLNVVRAFCESWCPKTNTLHTVAGEISISLWDLHKIGGLPISGKIYDETIPSSSRLQHLDDKGFRLVPRSCEHLFAAYCRILGTSRGGVEAEKWIDFWCKRNKTYEVPTRRRRYSSSGPRSTHNPDGDLVSKLKEWTREELSVFAELGITDPKVRDRTYLAAFLSCWLCVFVLPESNNRLIRPSIFEIASQMTARHTFSLAVPVLASIYKGLNAVVTSPKPANEGSCFPIHYLYGWLAYYFDTHHFTDPCPPGPIMVRYSGSQNAKWIKEDEARHLIHGGESFNWGQAMLSKNQNDSLFDDGKLDPVKMDYLISLRSTCLPLRVGSSFHSEPYNPHRFSRQFGFCQGIPTNLSASAQTISFDVALKYWRLILMTNSQSKVFLPCYTLKLHDMVTSQYQEWWSQMTVKDLRHNLDILMKGTGSLKDERAKSSKEGTRATSKKSTKRCQVVPESESSDGDSETKFKHRRGKKKTSSTDPKVFYQGDILEDVPSFSSTPATLALTGNFDLDAEVPDFFEGYHDMNIDLDVVMSQKTPGQGKSYSVVRQLATQEAAESDASDDEVQLSSPRSVDGPHSLEVAAKQILSTSQHTPIIRTDYGNKVLTPSKSVTSFCPGPFSQPIFLEAIKDMGARYLKSLKDAPFEEVEKRYQEAPMVYKAIKNLKGDPSPLKCKVEQYVAAVQSFIVLESVALKRQHPSELEKKVSLRKEKFVEAESHLNKVLADQEALEKKKFDLEQKIKDLEKELRTTHEVHKQVEIESEAHHSLIEEAEAQVTAAKEALIAAESKPTLTPEEIVEIEKRKSDLLELQSFLDPSAWMS